MVVFHAPVTDMDRFELRDGRFWPNLQTMMIHDDWRNLLDLTI